MKTGVIDVGGGFRNIYGAGVLNACVQKGIHFDYCIGISAGSANLTSYLASQPRRNYIFYMEYIFRKEYASFENWIKTRNYVDLDYSYSTISNSDGERPVDYDTMEKIQPSSLLTRVTRAQACPSILINPIFQRITMMF